MFETVHLHTRVSADGRLHLDLPPEVVPDSEVDVTVSPGARRQFFTREEWVADARRVVGSIPDIERPEQWPIREIEPL